MTLPDDDSLMLAYVYGELSDDEARAFEARLAADPGLRAEVDGLLATRDLLGQDARYGEISGADLPPPHLADAILRAEVIERPPEVRRAHATNGGGGFLARVQLWLVGGGLAVGAAAALLLVAKDGAMPEPEVAGEAPAVQQAPPAEATEGAEEAADDKAKVATGAAPAEPMAVPAGESQTGADLLPGQAPADGAGKLEIAALDDVAAANAPEQKAAGARRKKELTPMSLKKAAERRDAFELRPIGGGDGEAYAEPGLDEARGVPMKTPVEQAESSATPVEEAESPATRGLGAGGMGVASERADGKPGASMPSTDARGGRYGSSTSGAPTSSAPAPTATPVGPPPLPEAARRQLARKRAERKDAPARESAKGKARANEALAEELQLTLLTAERELEGGRALEALDLFTAVTRRDPRGALTGVVPYVGQMRALQALSRHREVLALLPLVKRPGIRATGVPEGILVAARSAEALGDVVLARSLYRELLVVKDKRKQAEDALERLDALSAVRSKAARESHYDAAADEPAAAAPAEE